jgi:tRNA A-37 threonylcarbamoyl transferase component Bud32
MTIAGERKCVQCGGEIPDGGLWGLCTRCLYNQSLESEAEGSAGQGRAFGNYELEEVLGRGGMGIVYKAIQRSPRRTVALKMILDSELASEASRRRFTLEAEMAAKLDHPNIVPIYEVGDQDGQPFLSMKLVSGETLRKKIESGELSMRDQNPGSRSTFRERVSAAVRLVVAISRAVQHAHDHGVLHRDLKPGNIIVDQEGRAHLTDFGLAKMLVADSEGTRPASDTLPGMPIGTPSYMSPEQAQGLRLSAASDIYSLGALFYEILTGKPPFEAATPLETLRKVLAEEPKNPRGLNPRVDKDLNTICMKCLEKNPARRYLTAGALADDLERWQRQEPICARPAGLGLRSARWIARNRVGTALIVSLCAGLAVALILLEQALARQRKLDLHRANNMQRLSHDVEAMWNDPGQGSVLIRSSTLADVADLPPREPDALAARLTFGKTVNHEPLGQAMQYAPFLSRLERETESILRRPVLIDLRFYKTEGIALRDLFRDKLSFQRMEPVLYVLSNATTRGMVPIVWERSRKEAVIFASNESGITNLAQAFGKRLVSGQANSTITFWAKVHLRRAGLRAADFQSCRYIDGENNEADLSNERREADRDPNVQANKRAIHEVAWGKADLGVAPRRQFELTRYRKRGLRELFSFPVPSDLYVAGPEFDPDLLQALRQSLLTFQSAGGKALLAGLSENTVIEGFAPVSDGDFEEIRAALKNEISQFEGEPSTEMRVGK